MRRPRTVSHEDRLPLVDHLDELRIRLVVMGATLGFSFALCFWQNDLILQLLNAPLPSDKEPITLGVTEPFMTTVTVSAYAAILLSLPLILHQVYGFLLPALGPAERRTALPLLLAVPMLFVAGVVFAYLIVLPAAIKFLLNFNESQFQIAVRAREYYGFVTQTLIALGVVFQVPVGILAATRLGLTSAPQLRRIRRYAYVLIAVVAMALPGTDP